MYEPNEEEEEAEGENRGVVATASRFARDKVKSREGPSCGQSTPSRERNKSYQMMASSR